LLPKPSSQPISAGTVASLAPCHEGESHATNARTGGSTAIQSGGGNQDHGERHRRPAQAAADGCPSPVEQRGCRAEIKSAAALLQEPSCLLALSAPIPLAMCLDGIACSRPLSIAILTIIETVLGGGSNTERGAVAIALYVRATAERAWVKRHFIHCCRLSTLTESAHSGWIELPRELPILR
jgi:hypothetical protein